jgi:hypothetical protein
MPVHAARAGRRLPGGRQPSLLNHPLCKKQKIAVRALSERSWISINNVRYFFQIPVII